MGLPRETSRPQLSTNEQIISLAKRIVISVKWSSTLPKMYNISMEADTGQYVCVKNGEVTTGPLRECAPECKYNNEKGKSINDEFR